MTYNYNHHQPAKVVLQMQAKEFAYHIHIQGTFLSIKKKYF
jgi:hypothetical protein